ncbi:MAG: hypothetical protein JSS47_21850 [Proteobacteria bacterium]|nr:hypothetical protein [Pseudomonadota bacterium]
MRFPTATKRSAFLSGVLLVALVYFIGALKSQGIISADTDEKELAPLLILFFFVSALLYVVDIRSIAPGELKTRIPLVYLPTNQIGVKFLLTVWGRMLIWFLGATTAAAFLATCEAILK